MRCVPVGAHLFFLLEVNTIANYIPFTEEQREHEQKNSNIIDRKLRQKIEEKKQAQGLKMG